jgi:uncharacterized protein with PQ loop repeat
MSDVAALIEFANSALSYGIVFGSGLLKAPQVVKIVRSGSAEGVSLTSLLLEAVGYSINTSWGIARALDFKDYGEGIIISVQVIALVLLVGYHQRRLMYALSSLAPIALAFCALSANMLPKHLHEALLTVALAVSLSSRVPQIYSNYKHKSTGQLAFLTFFLAFGGSAARVLTVAKSVPWEKGKGSMLFQFTLSTLMNLIIMLQMYVYRHAPKQAQKPVAPKHRHAPAAHKARKD